MVRQLRIRPPAQDSKKRIDEEGVVKRHVYEEGEIRKAEDKALAATNTTQGTQITNIQEDIGPGTVRDTVKWRLNEVEAQANTSTNQIGQGSPQYTGLWGAIGSGDPKRGIRGDIKTLNEQVDNINNDKIGEWSDNTEKRSVRGEIMQLFGMHDNQADSIQGAKNDISTINGQINNIQGDIRELKEFMNRPAKFAAAQDLTGAGVAHKH